MHKYIDDPQGLMKLKFCCPLCGGDSFGTSNALSDNPIGYCTVISPTGVRCKFKWDRNKDNDKNYFIPKN